MLFFKKKHQKNMNEEQQVAFDYAIAGKNIALLSAAGTGKTFVVQKIIQQSHKDQMLIGVTSSTGTSAITLGGRTLHSFLGIGLAKKSAFQLALTIKSKNQRKLKMLNSIHRLVIDEISMVSAELFDKISEYLSIIRRCKQPFGGIQVILSGDMCQLPPVDGEYCFKSKIWKELDLKLFNFSVLVRQLGDKSFQTILNEARFGLISKDSIKKLQMLHSTTFGEILPTVLYSKNIDVDCINNVEYEKLRQKEGIEERSYDTVYSSHANSKTWASSLKIPETVTLCTGAQVMLTVNLNVDEGFSNGSRGMVVEFRDEGPVVLFKNGDQIIVEPWLYQDENDDDDDDEGKEKIWATAIPLRLAYALTIHKSQSATLDAAVVSLGASIFEYGQAYTALSRVRDMQSIKVTDVLQSSFQTHPDVIEFYKACGHIN